jgi:hypothetical protein
MSDELIRVGVSVCLLGEEIRYNDGHTRAYGEDRRPIGVGRSGHPGGIQNLAAWVFDSGYDRRAAVGLRAGTRFRVGSLI